MSYQVLARKWRPHDFSSMLGQTHVLKALKNALDSNRLHHGYLFTGTRGVGKTTVARILAKCLNCEEGVSSSPCGKCSSCIEISQGRFIDLIEVDAASRTRVEDTRELLENTNYLPTRGRYKIYLIDEVHMLSQHSFNALLKTLEEPPEHVKFLLATTDPKKLPITILSRCLQFSLKSMSLDQITKYLEFVLKSENILFEDSALRLLAKSAKGSMRDALSLTEQAISYCDNNLTSVEVSKMLGSIDKSKIIELIEILREHNAKKLLKYINDLAEYSPDYENILDELLDSCYQIAVTQLTSNPINTNNLEQKQLLEISQKITAEDVQLFYQLGIIGKKDLIYAPDTRTGFEMILLRMMAFTCMDASDDQELENLDTQTEINLKKLSNNLVPPPINPAIQNRDNDNTNEYMENKSASLEENFFGKKL